MKVGLLVGLSPRNLWLLTGGRSEKDSEEKDSN